MDLRVFPASQVAVFPLYLLSGIVDRDDPHAGSVFLFRSEKVYTAIKSSEWIKNGNGDVVKSGFTTSPFPFLDILPYTKHVLHPQTY